MKRLVILALLTVMVTQTACGGDQSMATDSSKETARVVDTTRLERLGLKVISQAPGPIAGVTQVITDQGLFYLADGGTILLTGRFFDISQDGDPVNISERAMNALRAEALLAYEDSMLVYPAPQQQYVITVFTDTTCGYCRQLHENMANYHQAGVTVRYLAYPRSGPNGAAANTLRHIWCAADPQAAMDKGKAGKSVDAAQCDDPVAQHYALGQQFGVTGTPAIVLTNGELIPGLLPLPNLLERLQNLDD